jgi:hypothetical protein
VYGQQQRGLLDERWFVDCLMAVVDVLGAFVDDGVSSTSFPFFSSASLQYRLAIHP